ncbi:hypothetical protein F4678DRAFT_455781 [Xylaria arbuscula]|nr:hypothetical protein F4678DRAFT_455781 [Xylaria arbuscula]
MSPPRNQAVVVAVETLVETNNFYHIIQHFNDAGDLTRQNTRFSIECQICMSKSLSLINPDFDGPTQDHTHENYIVLPGCGHAFGSDCLQTNSEETTPYGPKMSILPYTPGLLLVAQDRCQGIWIYRSRRKEHEGGH